MKSKIDEVWEKYSGCYYNVIDEDYNFEPANLMTKSQFEKAVEELMSEKDAEIERLKLELYFMSYRGAK